MKLRPDAKKLFDLAIEGLIQPRKINNPQERRSSTVLAYFIKHSLKQFHLEQVDFYDVVSEVYLRGTNKITSGENIKNPGAWIRITSYNVIREMNRKQQKERANSEYIESQVAPKSCKSWEENELQLCILKRLLEELTEIERQILELRFFQDKSWKEVVDILTSTGQILTETNARQRGSRALKKLKTRFFNYVKSSNLSA
ncbi:MAG: sigma-70 family RNA polymerase sigma factor [Okeania sp. SIO3B5]|uniref:RNA polymerase sigma factor n=1 Tax=Okeania sp. SIO3B5 TaxID=2607811 RepID=UPI0013FF61AB|nr:sigma-70 family RNA polymerase sigma factor [Okeania sp. SIO3B5]NEO56192.1 sigma-70 family RNA polymerase sigma factor [Okeania sp. SIO3B5]